MNYRASLCIAGLAFACLAVCPVALDTPIEQPKLVMTNDFAVPVLMYHRVCNLTPEEERSPIMRDLTVSPKDFEQQLNYMKTAGFTFLHVSEVQNAIKSGSPLPEKAVAITLDDGYADNFTEAFPLLKKYGAKATVFMVTNNFERPGRLSWLNAKLMVKNAVGFESHTISHPDLSTLCRERVSFELSESKKVLERGLGQPITALAYPAGAFNPMVEVVAEQVGYLSAWKKGGGVVRPSHSSNMYELPRVRVHGRTDIEKFKTRVNSGLEILAMERRSRLRVASKDDLHGRRAVQG